MITWVDSIKVNLFIGSKRCVAPQGWEMLEALLKEKQHFIERKRSKGAGSVGNTVWSFHG